MPEEKEDEGYNWLEDPYDLCMFSGEEANIPTEVKIAANMDIIRLIRGLVVMNPDGPGIKNVEWRKGQAIPKDVLGVIVDKESVDFIQNKANGRGFLLRAPNDSDWLTLDQFKEKYKIDGLTRIVEMRWHWFTTGGGVTTPGQQVTGTHQLGNANEGTTQEPVKLGGNKPSRRA